jgi:hypothetical protein
MRYVWQLQSKYSETDKGDTDMDQMDKTLYLPHTTTLTQYIADIRAISSALPALFLGTKKSSV